MCAQTWCQASTKFGCQAWHQGVVGRAHLGQAVLRVHVHRLLVLDGAVVATALQFGGVEEEACRQRLLYGLVVLRVAHLPITLA